MKSDTLPLYTHQATHEEQVNDGKLQSATPSRARPHRQVATIMTLIAICYLLSSTILTSYRPSEEWHGSLDPLKHTELVAGNKTLVPLEAHIMSKCPDARDCLNLLVIPTMQKVSDKVNFTLSYIGTPTTNGGVDCMHGPSECMGNIIELCSAKLYPNPKIYLGFTMCLSRDYRKIPQLELVQDCALEHGIDFDKLHECAIADEGGLGTSMLRRSVRHSYEVGVAKSCTVRLNEDIYCVRDGGQWKECPNGPAVMDLVNAVERLYLSS